MASRKLTALPTATEVTTSDKIYIVDVSDTTESPQGTSKQATISELPSSGIPLSGTAEGAPLTGNIIAQSPASIRYVSGDELRSIGYNEDNEFGITIKDNLSGAQGSISVASNGNGITVSASNGSINGVAGIQLNAGEYSFIVTTDKIGFFDKGNSIDAAAQAAAIANATNATDVITQLNTLLAAMRAYGLIAE